jgi:hypothetical protein
MTIRKDPLVSDITVVNDLRALLFDALEHREPLLNGKSSLTDLRTWSMGCVALERLNRFFVVAQESECAFAYPTLLYNPARSNVEKHGYHFSAPPVLHIAQDYDITAPERHIRLRIPQLVLSSEDLAKSAYFIEREVDAELSSHWQELAALMQSIFARASRSLAVADPFAEWNRSNLVAVHTYGVANTDWDQDSAACTELQRRVVATKIKYAHLQPESPYEVLPRGIAYFAMAKSKEKGLCHSSARDHVLAVFRRKSWAEIIEDVVYSKAPLIRRFQETLLTVLDCHSTAQESALAGYCRQPALLDEDGRVDAGAIREDAIRSVVDGWEARVWRHLLRDILTKSDLKENRLKTLAYRVATGALIRYTLADVRDVFTDGVGMRSELEQ